MLVASPGLAQVQPRVVQPVDNTQRLTLIGNVHPLARPEFDRGEADNALPMARMLLVLKRSDERETALEAYLEHQQDKSSLNYHAWLTPEQFGTQYGPADADIEAVTQWLRSQGFRIEKVYSGKTVIEFSGSAAQVRTAFGAAIHTYEVIGKTYTANTSDPQIPVALAPVVAGIVSLNSFPRQWHARIVGQAKKIPGQPGLQPEFTFPSPGGGANFYAVAPGDFATIYGSKGLITAGNDGTGQSIAIVGETNVNVSDVQAFRSLFGLPSTFTSANVILNGADPGITSVSEEGEADLDTQWSGAVAPGATVNLVVSASTSTTPGIDLSALYIVEKNLAGVMSESYGSCEVGLGAAENAFYNSLWQQASAQGITVVVSTGDNGSAGCDDFNNATVATHGLGVNGFASTPYNVAAGGTDFDQVNKWSTYWSATNATSGTDVIGTSSLGYIPEIPWNQNCAQIGLTGCTNNPPNGSVNIIAGSGGFSSLYTKPSWQIGVPGMPNDNHRDLPDISLFASPGFDGSGYIVCQADAYANTPCSIATPGGVNVQIVGGTSAAAPAFAGIMALINQYAAAHGGTSRQGNANFVLYALGKRSGAICASGAAPSAACIFNDIVKGNSFLPTGLPGIGTNSVPCQGGTANCSVPNGTGVLVELGSPTIEAWTATAGYDLATGLGSVNIASLAQSWVTVNTTGTSTGLTLSPTTGIAHGSSESVSVNISVTSASGPTATGDVSLIAHMPDGTTLSLGQFTLASGGNFSGTTQSLPGGSYTVSAHYAGNGTDAPSDSTPPISVTVTPEASKTLANLITFDINGNSISYTASSATYGSGYGIFRVDVGDSNASVSSSAGISSNCSRRITGCPTGSLALSSSGTSLGTGSMALNILGYAETPPLAPGNYSITANYPGDASYAASTGNASFTIAKAPTTATAGYAGTPVQYGNSEEIVANVATTSAGIAPTGTFQFLVDGTAAGSPVQVSESSGYSPGGNPPNYAWADGISSTSFMSVGNHTLAVQYGGDTNYAPSASAGTTVSVTQALPSFNSYGPNPGQTNVNQQVSLVAQLYGSAKGVPPTGTFTFYDGTTPLSGTITYTPVNATQLTGSALRASIPYTPMTVGSHSITVSYSGDSNYLQATSAPPAILTVIGPDFSMTPQTTSATVAAGSAATFTIAVASIDGLTSNVSVSCSLSAAAVTCSANPSSVVPGTNTTITVATTKHQATMPSPSEPRVPAIRFWVLFITTLATALWLACNRKMLRQRKLAAVIHAAVLMCLALIAAACGGASGVGGGGGSTQAFGTQPGTYTVTITGSIAGATHTTTVLLTVQ